jgi:hypothetical protein
VIPTPQQLEDISLRREGTLLETPFSALLLAHAVQQRTVAVEFRRKQVTKRVVFEQGVPVECRSNLVHETLGRYMVALGKLPEADLLPYLNQSASRGVPLGEVLLEHEVVGAEELFRLLQQNLAKKLLDVFSWREGEFRLLADRPEPDSPLKVRVPQLIVTGITKYAAAAEVEAGVVPLVGKKLALHPEPRWSLEEIRLSARQTQAVMALQSGWRMDELAVGTGMPFEELNRLLYALAVLGVVVTAETLPRRATGPLPLPGPPEARGRAAAPAVLAAGGEAPGAVTTGAAAAPSVSTAQPASAGRPGRATVPMSVLVPASTLLAAGVGSATGEEAAGSARGAEAAESAMGAEAAESGTDTETPGGGAATAPAAREADPGPSAERRNAIVQAYLSHRRQDSFELLGVPEDTTLPAVEEAYLAFARRFAPWTLTGPQQESIEEKARALFFAGARAYAELVDTEQRNTLLLRRKTLRAERRGRHAPDAFAIKTDLLDPEAQFKKGRALVEMGKHREALLQLEFAADCDPQNGLYAAELAWCRFLHSPASATQALGELEETLRRDPDCGIALYYAGEIHRQLGQKAQAEALLRRAIKAMSPDRRPIEALKALSAEKRR